MNVRIIILHIPNDNKIVAFGVESKDEQGQYVAAKAGLMKANLSEEAKTAYEVILLVTTDKRTMGHDQFWREQ